MQNRTAFAAAAGLVLAALLPACRQSVEKDGYQGRFSIGVGESIAVAARGGRTRFTRIGGTGEVWITIRRPDLGKQWDYRPFGRHANKVIESKLSPLTRESYWENIPPSPGFDAQKYAEQFQGSARLRDHLLFAEHPCDVYDVSFFQGGVDRIWIATDLGRLPVRVQRGTLVESDSPDPNAPQQLRARADYQMLKIEAGAPPELFELPAGATIIPNPEDQ